MGLKNSISNSTLKASLLMENGMAPVNWLFSTWQIPYTCKEILSTALYKASVQLKTDSTK